MSPWLDQALQNPGPSLSMGSCLTTFPFHVEEVKRHRSFTLGLICWTAALPNIGKVLMRYRAVKEARLFLPVEFSTLSEYLHHLKAAAQALRPIGSKAMFYLAAAVSDFYIQASEMPEHKIQSSNGPLQISMKMVPKMLSPLVDWAPQAFGISFKLEMDPSILLDRARRALDNRLWWPAYWTPDEVM